MYGFLYIEYTAFGQMVKHVAFAVLIYLPLSLVGQSDSSKTNYYLELAKKTARKNPKAALEYIDSARTITPDDFSELRGQLTFQEAISRGSLLQYDSAIGLFEEVEPIFLEFQDSFHLARTYGELGKIYGRQNMLDLSIANLTEAIKIQERLKDSTAVGANENGLGIMYKQLKQYGKAREHFASALAIFKALNREGAQLSILNNLAGISEFEGDYEKAIAGYEKLIKIANNNPRYKQVLGITFNNIGLSQKKMGDHGAAYDSFRKASSYFDKSDNSKEALSILANLAFTSFDLGRTSQSEKYLSQYLEPAQEKKLFDGLMQAYILKGKLARQKGDAEDVYSWMQKAISFQDSVNSKRNEQVSLELAAKYEDEKKEGEIKLLNKENEIAALELEASERRSLVLGLGVGMLGLLSFFIYIFYRKTQSQAEVIAGSLAEKEVLLKEIHHRVKNNLQFISSLLGLQTEHVKDKGALGALEEGQNRVQSMALIHQNLYQEDNLKGVDLREYFTKLTRGLFDSYNVRKGQIRLDMDIEHIGLDVDTVVPLGLIVNELVSNALKYAFPGDRRGSILVTLKEEGQKLKLIVRDDGVGMSDAQKEALGSSFGYRLVSLLKDQLRAELHIDATMGTTVKMEIGKYDMVAL